MVCFSLLNKRCFLSSSATGCWCKVEGDSSQAGHLTTAGTGRSQKKTQAPRKEGHFHSSPLMYGKIIKAWALIFDCSHPIHAIKRGLSVYSCKTRIPLHSEFNHVPVPTGWKTPSWHPVPARLTPPSVVTLEEQVTLFPAF